MDIQEEYHSLNNYQEPANDSAIRAHYFAIAAAATGIVSLLIALGGSAALALTSIAGVVFGVMGFKSTGKFKGLTLAGIVTSAIALAYGAILIAIILNV